MDEKTARNLLGDAIHPEGLYNLGWYLGWERGADYATLDGQFTAEDLEAIAWWMKNGGKCE